MSFRIRRAEPQDIPALLGLIRELADYEKLLGELENDVARLEAALFAPEPKVHCEVADAGTGIVGYAIWFYSYSTFTGRHGIYLEDLYVQAAHRGKGIGKAFLTHLAKRCVAEGRTRLEWQVLDWNAPSIEFYRSTGARQMDGWTGFRLAGDALAALGNRGS